MNAAEIDRMKKENKHLTPKEEERGHRTCWCGLCHCQKCQNLRRARRQTP
jgi:hypothetical protein